MSIQPWVGRAEEQNIRHQTLLDIAVILKFKNHLQPDINNLKVHTEYMTYIVRQPPQDGNLYTKALEDDLLWKTISIRKWC